MVSDFARDRLRPLEPGILLALLGPPSILAWLSSVALGAGGLFYSAYWPVAALTAPGLGSTSAAKEALAWLAIPSSGACVAGLVGALICSIRAARGPRPA